MDEGVICNHCNSKLKNNNVLKTHLKTNKRCLTIRGITFKTEFICDGCKSMLITMSHLRIHKDTCKEYQKLMIESEKEEQFILKIKNQETKHRKKLKEKDEQISHLKNSLESLQKQYAETKEDYKTQVERLQDRIDALAKEAINRPTTTNINNIRNNLSTTYTLEGMKDDDLMEIFREHFTKQIFMSGHKGIAKMCTEKIIHTKDKKKLICCTDVSRGKFKYMDKKGNLKEDIEARMFVDRVSKPIKDVGKELYDNIMEKLTDERDHVKPEEYGKKERLTMESFQVMDRYKDIINIDDSKYNAEFTTELAKINVI